MAVINSVTQLENSGAELQAILQPASSLIDEAACVWLHLRSREVAALAGRNPDDVTESDFEQALQEAICECFRSRQRGVG